MNPKGAAIALGRPLFISGARLILTATEELHGNGGCYAFCTICIGGQGASTVIGRV